MKIAFILMVYLGLVACNNQTNNVDHKDEDEPSQMCLRCQADKKIREYINEPGADHKGEKFWGLVEGFQCKGLFDESEVLRFRAWFKSEEEIVFRGESWNTAGYQLLNYLRSKDKKDCCFGAQRSCEVGISKEKVAIKQLKDFIEKNHPCSQSFQSMLNLIYMTEVIPLEQKKAYERLMKGQYKEKIKELAQLLLQEVFILNADNELKEYKKKLEVDPGFDEYGNRLIGMVTRYNKEGMLNDEYMFLNLLANIGAGALSGDLEFVFDVLETDIEIGYEKFVKKLLEG